MAELLGAGGMGVLYKATDTRLGRTVALKFLPPQWGFDAAFKARFEREARAVAALDHPNVCAIYEVGETEQGQLFIAMACYQGETVKEKIAYGSLEVDEAVDLATQAARGLAAAHASGIVHRDIKPANLVVTEDGVLKILDFGLAKADDLTLTSPGLRLGTVAYMSPEQTRGDEVDYRADLWSLGVVLYEMLTGRRPFRGKNDRVIIQSIRHESPKPPFQLREDLSPDLQAVVLRLLSTEPEARVSAARWLLGEGSVPGAEAGGAPRRSRKRAAFAAVAVTTPAIAGLIVANAVGRDAPEIRRLAVLHLANLTGDPEQDYFVAGMHDALVTELAQIGALMVTSRQSVLRYEGSDRPIPEIARELGVDALVEGSVFRAGDSVRITVQLVRAEPEEHLWTGTYLGALHDALALQGDVARGLASAVDARVGPEERERLASRRAVDPAAQEAYLQGLYLVEKQAITLLGPEEGGETLQTAIRYLEQAVALDPEWAAAHAKLALAYHWLASRFPEDHADEFYPKSKAAALRALELDETEAQAHASLGFVLFHHERDWVGAEREILRAMELEPSLENHWIYALYLSWAGRYEDALTQFHKAEERNPLSEVLKMQVAYAYRCAGRYEEAISQLEELEARVGSDVPGLRRDIGYEYSAMSKHDEAIAELEGAVARSDSHPQSLAMLAYVYARAGQNDEARRLLGRIEDRPDDWWAPELYAALGETDRAVASLRAQFESTPDRIGGYKCGPAYRALRDEPQIQEVVRRFGFEPN